MRASWPSTPDGTSRVTPITTGQAAGELNTRFGTANINGEKVRELVAAGALEDRGTWTQVRIESTELGDFVRRTRFVTRAEWPTADLFRVSLLAAGPELHPLLDARGGGVRRFVGADYSPSLRLVGTPVDRDLAWLGVWEVSDANADLAVAHDGYLMGTTKGYIHPDYVRRITGWHRTATGSAMWWEVAPLDPRMAKFVGTGLWMDVKPGRKSDWA